MMKGIKSAVDYVLGGWEKEMNGRKRRSGKTHKFAREGYLVVTGIVSSPHSHGLPPS